MVNTQTWLMGLILYFMGLFTVITLFGVANATTSITTNTNYYQPMTDITNQTSTQAASNVKIDWKDTFRFVFSFFLWDINVFQGNVLMQYFWILRLFLVYLPFMALIATLYYSLPWVSG